MDFKETPVKIPCKNNKTNEYFYCSPSSPRRDGNDKPSRYCSNNAFQSDPSNTCRALKTTLPQNIKRIFPVDIVVKPDGRHCSEPIVFTRRRSVGMFVETTSFLRSFYRRE